jgi:hypothetical protein
MDQKIFNNIIFLLIIVLIIRQVSPDTDSVLYILKKYINYIIFSITNIFTKEDFMSTGFRGNTFSGLKKFENKAPYILNHYDKKLITYLQNINSKATEAQIRKLLSITNAIISISVDSYFATPSDEINYKFNSNEIDKIKNILLTKLNKYGVTFSNLNFDTALFYYHNIAGKEVKPFTATVDTDNGFTNLKIYFDINIRNDIKKNTEYLVINNARIIIDPEFKLESSSAEPPKVEIDENVFNYLPVQTKFSNSVPTENTNFNDLDFESYIPPSTDIDFSSLTQNNNTQVLQTYKDFNEHSKDISKDYPTYSQPEYSQEFSY